MQSEGCSRVRVAHGSIGSEEQLWCPAKREDAGGNAQGEGQAAGDEAANLLLWPGHGERLGLWRGKIGWRGHLGPADRCAQRMTARGAQRECQEGEAHGGG
eukprot:4836695-Prymnesium_polylepis.1